MLVVMVNVSVRLNTCAPLDSRTLPSEKLSNAVEIALRALKLAESGVRRGARLHEKKQHHKCWNALRKLPFCPCPNLCEVSDAIRLPTVISGGGLWYCHDYFPVAPAD